MMKAKTVTQFLCLIFLLCVSLILALSYGSADIGFSEIVDIVKKGLLAGRLYEDGSQGPLYDIIWLLRMPRIILAVCVGSGLAVSGVIMQAIVKNPLADPYILGISSGASLGATAAVLLGVGKFLGANFIGISAFLGAFMISLLVLFISNIGGPANSVKLLLSGMALSAVCSAFSSFIVYFANNMEGIQTISYWLMGSLAGARWSELFILMPLLCCCILLLWSQKRILNLMLMGDEAAITMGLFGRYVGFYRAIDSPCGTKDAGHGPRTPDTLFCGGRCGVSCLGGPRVPNYFAEDRASHRNTDFPHWCALLCLSDDQTNLQLWR